MGQASAILQNSASQHGRRKIDQAAGENQLNNEINMTEEKIYRDYHLQLFSYVEFDKGVWKCENLRDRMLRPTKRWNHRLLLCVAADMQLNMDATGLSLRIIKINARYVICMRDFFSCPIVWLSAQVKSFGFRALISEFFNQPAV